MADFEFHFPRHVAAEYEETFPNIFDSPPLYGVDEYVLPYATDAFIEIYYYVRRKFLPKQIPEDVAVYHQDDGGISYYDVKCRIHKSYQFDRLVTMHSVIVYRHPIIEEAKGLSKNVNDYKSLYLIDEVFSRLKRLKVPFSLVRGHDAHAKYENRRFRLLVNHHVMPIAAISNYYSPLSFTNQIIYSLARFISEHGLVNEYLCADLKGECDDYAKKCIEAFRTVKGEIEEILKEDLLIKAAEYVLSHTPPGDGVLTLPVNINDLVDEFNSANGTDLSVRAVIDKVNKLIHLGKVLFDEERRMWVLHKG